MSRSLPIAVARVVRASGLTPLQWAVRVAGIPKSTLRDLMRTGTASGKTLAKLQDAGVVIADRKLIASLDVTGDKSKAA